MTTTDRKITLWASMTVLMFNNWVLGFLLDRTLLTRGGSISELSAAGRPHHILFRLFDTVAGLMILVLAYLIRSRKVTAAFVAILGLANIADACLPLPCSGTLDPSCAAPVNLSIHHLVIPSHAYSSAVIGACFLALPLAVLWQTRKRPSRRLVSISAATLLATLMFFGALLAQSLSGSYSGSALVGYSQEVQIIIFSIWLLVYVRFTATRSVAPGSVKPPED